MKLRLLSIEDESEEFFEVCYFKLIEKLPYDACLLRQIEDNETINFQDTSGRWHKESLGKYSVVYLDDKIMFSAQPLRYVKSG